MRCLRTIVPRLVTSIDGASDDDRGECEFKAAAAASAITLVPTKLKPGGSTDGAVFS